MNDYAPDIYPETRTVPSSGALSSRWLAGLSRLEHAKAADPVIQKLQRSIRSLPMGEARDLLRGRPLGHPVHPVLVQVPIGCWLSAAVMDAVPGGQRAATTLTAVGLAGVAPAAVTGWVDWADLPPEQARVGLAHAVANVTAVAFFAASLTARLRRHQARGRLWSLAGLAAVGVTGALGGHVAYRQAVGAWPAT
ncbi:DUF2231 domain-containing protein [Streptomyces sp. NPDC058751]|uniref:DUF2231 domain-containing protein n=1 Tax=Streptomyces sp. NPDC058751 TaxID=3346623 RepID=UPI0036AEC286